MRKILYALLFSALVISCNKPDPDDQTPPADTKLVEKIDLTQDGTKLCSFEFTYNVDKTIRTLAVKLTDKYISGVCNLAGYTETYTFGTNGTPGKMDVSRDRGASSGSASFSFNLDNKGRVVSGVNNSNTSMTASYKYNADGVLTKFEQGVMCFDYAFQNNQKFVIESFLGAEEGQINYPVNPNMVFDRNKINIDLNMLLVCMKSTSGIAAGIAFLDPMFLGMFGYLGGREPLVNRGSRGFQGALEYTTNSEGSPIEITVSKKTAGKPDVINSYTITYLQ